MGYTVHGVAKSWTRPSNFHTHTHLRLPNQLTYFMSFSLDFFASFTLLTALILFPFSLWHYFWFSSLFTVCSKHSPSTSLCPNIDFSFGSALSHLLVSSCSSLVIASSFFFFYCNSYLADKAVDKDLLNKWWLPNISPVLWTADCYPLNVQKQVRLPVLKIQLHVSLLSKLCLCFSPLAMFSEFPTVPFAFLSDTYD